MPSESLLIHFKKHKIIIALAALAQTWLSYQLFNIPINPYILLFITIATPLSYKLAESFSFTLNQEKISFLKFDKIFFAFAFLTLTLLLSYLSKKTIGQFAIAAIIAIGYNFPLNANKKSTVRLRQIKGLKVFLIAFSWTFVTVYIPINIYAVNKISLGIVLINNFLFVAALCLLFDIRDLKKDQGYNLPSIPVLVGEVNSYHIIRIMHVALLICTCLLYPYFGYKTIFALSSHIFISYLVIFKYKRSRMDFYYIVLVDGLLISQALVVWIAKNI